MDDLRQAEADQRFHEGLAREDAQALATVSIDEPEDGPFGMTIRTLRTMSDGTRRPHMFRMAHGDQDLLDDPTELRAEMYRVVLADYWAARRVNIGRHYGITE
jgi:hypothetical protein